MRLPKSHKFEELQYGKMVVHNLELVLENTKQYSNSVKMFLEGMVKLPDFTDFEHEKESQVLGQIRKPEINLENKLVDFDTFMFQEKVKMKDNNFFISEDKKTSFFDIDRKEKPTFFTKIHIKKNFYFEKSDATPVINNYISDKRQNTFFGFFQNANQNLDNSTFFQKTNHNLDNLTFFKEAQNKNFFLNSKKQNNESIKNDPEKPVEDLCPFQKFFNCLTLMKPLKKTCIHFLEYMNKYRLEETSILFVDASFVLESFRQKKKENNSSSFFSNIQRKNFNKLLKDLRLVLGLNQGIMHLDILHINYNIR
jgi:hypothetical protein